MDDYDININLPTKQTASSYEYLHIATSILETYLRLGLPFMRCREEEKKTKGTYKLDQYLGDTFSSPL